MLSIRDFAKENGVSYEAVRKQIKRYEQELEGHIHRQGRTQYLDAVAVAFLGEHRAKPGISLYEGGSDDQEVQELRKQLQEAYKAQAEAWRRAAQLEGAQARLEAAEKETQILEGFIEDAKTEIATLTKEKAQEAQRASEASQKAEKALLEAQELRSRLEASEARGKALEAKQREFDSLPFWKKPFWRG